MQEHDIQNLYTNVYCKLLLLLIDLLIILSISRAGRGGLARNGEFWYPVRLMQHHEKEQTWSVRWWKGCDFGVSPTSTTIIPGSITQTQEVDIVDSLWGERTARRAIRVRSHERKHRIITQISISLESGRMRMKYQVLKTFSLIHPLPPTRQIFMRPYFLRLKFSNHS